MRYSIRRSEPALLRESNKFKIRTIHPSVFFLPLFVLVSLFAKSQCTASSTLHAGTVVNDNSTGALSFNNPGNGTIADNNRASASVALSLLSGNTYYLKASNFGFSFPLTYNICGVEVEIRKRANGLGIGAWIQDNEVKLVKAGAITGSSTAFTGANWGSADTYITHGGSGQLWGTTLTPADVNSSNFGVAISAKFNGLALVLPSAQVDDIRMTIYYSIPLPVRIVSFDGLLRNKSVHLVWQTADEEDNDIVILQRLAPDQSDWSDIASYDMHTGNNKHTYSYDDLLNKRGNYSYRLKTRGASAQFTYSKIINISFDGANALSLYPNPSADFIIIEGEASAVAIRITDQSGRWVKAKTVALGYNRVQADIQSLPPGIYFVSTGSGKLKFVKN